MEYYIVACKHKTKILKSIPQSTSAFGSGFAGLQLGSSLVDMSWKKFTRLLPSTGNRIGLVHPNRLLWSFGRGSSISKKKNNGKFTQEISEQWFNDDQKPFWYPKKVLQDRRMDWLTVFGFVIAQLNNTAYNYM